MFVSLYQYLSILLSHIFIRLWQQPPPTYPYHTRYSNRHWNHQHRCLQRSSRIRHHSNNQRTYRISQHMNHKYRNTKRSSSNAYRYRIGNNCIDRSFFHLFLYLPDNYPNSTTKIIDKQVTMPQQYKD